MNRALPKIARRIGRFLADGLTFRRARRQDALVAWSLVGGSIWLGASLASGAVEPEALCSGLYLLAILMAVCAIDARFGIIPDSVNLALAAGGVADYAFVHGAAVYIGVFEAAAVFVAVAAFRSTFRLLRGYDGFGFGDVKFISAASLWIGFAALPEAVLIAVGSALAAILLFNAERYEVGGRPAIPFGPHLAAGIWLTWNFDKLWSFGSV
ncbi:prepilin peptidase [Bradyrhizobium diazoefficiens]|uniref:prepilin peptidase n=1 Tax=Bradyrhizobium diazoefficiens TaxID=1355477 RepID=UPI00190ADFDB|nr:A24 family peptidase [Bradyrhizobium diazoefficiens]MBK3665368.1 prepilin peptidase [Bradyrhizobium diazoefficiens]